MMSIMEKIDLDGVLDFLVEHELTETLILKYESQKYPCKDLILVLKDNKTYNAMKMRSKF